MNSYQAITRTIIMLGTIAVGIMAWRVYGPPAEKLAPMIDRSFELANELMGKTQSEPAVELLPSPTLSKAEESIPAISLPSGPPLRVDTDVAPASHAEPIANAPNLPLSPVDTGTEPIDDLLAQLKGLGAVETSLQPWGTGGKTYRFECRLASPERPSIERHFDAIDSDPIAAVKQVLDAVRRQLGR